jgi:hypothetical protein
MVGISIQMSERQQRRRRRGSSPEATFDGSRGIGARIAALGATLRHSGGVAVGVAVAGALAALLMAVTELLTVASVDVASGSCELINDANPSLADRCALSGLERHGGAFLLLALLTLTMALGASVGRSGPAAVALIAIGALVLGIALAVDLPQTHETGAIGRNFEGAKAQAGPGLFTELAAGVLAMGAGALRLLRPD